MHLLHAESEPPHLVEDLVGGLDPLEGDAAFVVHLDVGEDRVPQLRDARCTRGTPGAPRRMSTLSPCCPAASRSPIADCDFTSCWS